MLFSNRGHALLGLFLLAIHLRQKEGKASEPMFTRHIGAASEQECGM
jgi:hypothetical protein